jgi:ribosome biogenesis protein ERB1
MYPCTLRLFTSFPLIACFSKQINAIRNGWIRDPADAPPPPPETYLLWDDTPKTDEHSHKYEPIPAPKVRLPGHNESYNPPEEYLLTKQQEEIWREQEPDERYVRASVCTSVVYVY